MMCVVMLAIDAMCRLPDCRQDTSMPFGWIRVGTFTSVVSPFSSISISLLHFLFLALVSLFSIVCELTLGPHHTRHHRSFPPSLLLLHPSPFVLSLISLI